MNTATQHAPGDLAAIVSGLGITIKSEFVPFSKSRNAKEKHKTLNWKVTLYKDGREVICTDYSAGVAYCPAYKLSVREAGGHDSIMRHGMIAWECENGYAARAFDHANNPEGYTVRELNTKSRKPIEPNALDVIYSLMADADVLNEFSYEDWAANTGYDPDSRKGEALYRSCLEIALKLRNGIGEKALAELREAFQDY
jgi:hypothetical protein